MTPDVVTGSDLASPHSSFGARPGLLRPIEEASQIASSTSFSHWRTPNLVNGKDGTKSIELPGLTQGADWKLESAVSIERDGLILVMAYSQKKRPAPLAPDQSFAAQISFPDGHVVPFSNEESQALVVTVASRVQTCFLNSKAGADELRDSVLLKGEQYTWHRVQKDKSEGQDNFIARVGESALIIVRPEGPQWLGAGKTWSTAYYDLYFTFGDMLLPRFRRSETSAISPDNLEPFRRKLEETVPKNRVMSWEDYISFHPAYNTSPDLPLGVLLEKY